MTRRRTKPTKIELAIKEVTSEVNKITSKCDTCIKASGCQTTHKCPQIVSNECWDLLFKIKPIIDTFQFPYQKEGLYSLQKKLYKKISHLELID